VVLKKEFYRVLLKNYSIEWFLITVKKVFLKRECRKMSTVKRVLALVFP